MDSVRSKHLLSFPNRPSGVGLWLAHTLLGLPFAYKVTLKFIRQLEHTTKEATVMSDSDEPFKLDVKILVHAWMMSRFADELGRI